MARELKPCGTPAAYRRHLRRNEPVDDACRAAVQRKPGDPVLESAPVLRLAPAKPADPDPDPDDELDELAEAKENLELVKAAMATATAASMASLSKRRQELVSLIAELGKRAKKQSNPEVSVLDQLAARRARRLSASSD